jgi:hypothetical protein
VARGREGLLSWPPAVVVGVLLIAFCIGNALAWRQHILHFAARLNFAARHLLSKTARVALLARTPPGGHSF